MTAYIEREIARARGFEGVVRCLDSQGRPLAGVAVSLDQTASPFRIVVRYSDDPPAALAQFARLGTDLLAPFPPPPALLETCEALSLRVVPVLPAPRSAGDLPPWRERYLPELQQAATPASGPPAAVASWALDLGEDPAPASVVRDPLARLREQTARPVALLGLRLPLRELPPPADVYGIRIRRPGDEAWHLAELRRRLCEAAALLGCCFVHDLRPPRGAPEPPPRSWRMGGSERFHADVLAQWVTLCFSVPGVSGVFCDRLADSAEDAGGLLAPDLRPKRSFKVLRALVQHEWRSRARGTTGPDGCFAWRGLHGSYELTLFRADGTLFHAEGSFGPADGSPAVWEVRA